MGQGESARGEWARGWPTVASGGIGMVVVSGVATVTGVVMQPLAAQFGWSRTLITANVMICSVLTLLLAPAIGHLIGRHGVRRCAIVGILTAIPAIAAIALNPGSAAWWIGSWIVFGIFNTLLGPLLWSTATTQIFDRARGLALAITLSGGGLAFALFPPLALRVVEHSGWRGVYLAFAALFALVLLPVTLVWFHGRPAVDAAAFGSGAGSAARRGGASPALARALRGRHFWQLALVCLLVAGVEGAMAIHLFPILREGGLAPGAAATAASTMGAAMVVGRLGTGFMQDRWPARHVFAAAIAAIALSCGLARVFAGEYWQGVLIATLLGLGAGGTINSLAYLTGRYFGLAAYASIFGLLMGLFAVGYGAAPMAASHARELADSYAPQFPGFIAVLLLCVVLSIMMGREPDRTTAELP